MSEPRIAETVDPDEAFAALADDTRIDILRALWDADGQELSFSDLREAVEIRDSGQFNYHLGKLTGRFVAKTDDGYELRPAGIQVVGALLAGAYTMAGAADPVELDDPCPTCGEDMVFEYEDERVAIDCVDCPLSIGFPVPPGVFAGYELEQLPDVAGRYGVTFVRMAEKEFCPYCEGRILPTVEPLVGETVEEAPERLVDVPAAECECERCGQSLTPTSVSR